jgi:hypothetical protein
VFLAGIQDQVNNYFAVHCEEAFRKLQKASELAGSSDPENHALLLTSVRRAVKSVADHFYPPAAEPILCSDGRTRLLGEDAYLNRLQVSATLGLRSVFGFGFTTG